MVSQFSLISCYSSSHVATTTLQPFYGPLSGTIRVSRYQKKHSLTHTNPDHQPSYRPLSACPYITIHSLLPVQFTCLTVSLHLSASSIWSTSWHPPLHTPYNSSSNHCLLFTTHTQTVATCFAVVPRLSSNPSLSLNYLLGSQFFIILIFAR